MARKKEKKEEPPLEEEVVEVEDTDVEEVESEVAKDEVNGEADQLEEPKEKIEATPLFLAREEAEMYKDRWIRLAAEFENYKKRRAREFETLVQSASEDVIRDLLPILDGVGRALAHSENGDTESEGFQEGIKMIMEQFPRVLYNRNLKEIETIGKPFDPTVHEALMQMPSEIHDAGIVADEIEKGYSLGDKVLRPAKVVVSQGKPTQETPEGGEEADKS
jgi:molecular chaperone GrpE